MTNREIVSTIRGTNKLLSSDGLINDRTILSLAKSMSKTLSVQKANQRRGWNTNTLFESICIELKQAPLSDCCAAPQGKMVSRSVHKIPKIVESNYSYLMQGIFNVELETQINVISISRYINLSKLPGIDKKVFAWFHNDYLYISGPFVKQVKLVAMFSEDVPKKFKSKDCGCGNAYSPCTSPLDEEFKCPANLESTIITGVAQTLLSTYFQINDDKSSNNKDDQVSRT